MYMKGGRPHVETTHELQSRRLICNHARRPGKGLHRPELYSGLPRIWGAPFQNVQTHALCDTRLGIHGKQTERQKEPHLTCFRCTLLAGFLPWPMHRSDQLPLRAPLNISLTCCIVFVSALVSGRGTMFLGAVLNVS